MKQKVKRWLSVLLAAVLLLSLVPVGAVELALTASAAKSGYYTYSVSNGEATITDVSTSISGNVVIPSTLGGYPVTSIGNDAFYHCTSLTSVTIPAGVTSIGSWAFSYCTSLTSVSIPAGVTSIGDYAFYGCTSLQSVSIPDSVTEIGSSAFFNTAYYQEETNWENGVLYIGNYLIDVEYDITGEYIVRVGTKTIASHAFDNCTSLTSVAIPDSVTSIGNYAFYNCTSLTSVTIPAGVTSIGGSAFNNCTSLTSVSIPAGVTEIGSSAFSRCTSLTSVSIPAGVTSIGSYAFSRCTSLQSVTIPAGVTSIGGYAFSHCTSLTSVSIPDSVTEIGSSAFFNTAYYQEETNWEDGGLYIDNHLIKASQGASGEYILKEGTKTIAGGAFQDCALLQSVTIPAGMTSIGGYTFSGCSSLASITIPDSVTSIGDYAFYNCTSLTSVSIPDSVTSIGYEAFHDCYSLNDVWCYGPAEAYANLRIYGYNAWFRSARWHYGTCVSAHIFASACDEQCDVCEWTREAVAHSYDAVCDAECNDCGTVREATEHEWDEGHVLREPTPDQYGEKVFTCTVCGETRTSTLTQGAIVDGIYYYNGQKTANAGLVQVGDDYYYVVDGGKVKTGRYAISKVNDTGVTRGIYYFFEDGRMNTEAGVYDNRYYGVTGKSESYAGLIRWNDAKYYVGDNGKVRTGRFYVTKPNGVVPTKHAYTFREDGSMVENGIYDGKFYRNGLPAALGLIEYEGEYYYAGTRSWGKVSGAGVIMKGEVAVAQLGCAGKSYGRYYFDTDGRMVTDTVVGGRYYSPEGTAPSYLGLVKAADGYFYYVQAQGKVVRNNPSFFVSNTNGYVAKGRYAFDENGRMLTA